MGPLRNSNNLEEADGKEASKLDPEAEARGLEKRRKDLHDTVSLLEAKPGDRRRKVSWKVSGSTKTSSHRRTKKNLVDLAPGDLTRGVSVKW